MKEFASSGIFLIVFSFLDGENLGEYGRCKEEVSMNE
jgi:hypothetical protein